MSEPAFDPVAVIAEHSAGFARAAEGNLDARVEHCPEWSVADLVRHLTAVQWFWGAIVEERLQEPPQESRRPAHVTDDQLIPTFVAGAQRLARVLRDADPADAVWTWAPAQRDVAFVVRHQVQEAAVHHWDAAHAAGDTLAIAAPVAADAVEEFLTFSVSSDADPADPPRPPLDGSFALRCTDIEAGWTVSDASTPGTLRADRGVDARVAELAATASDLLLWLYGRVDVGTGSVSADLLQRFRALCFTD
jgi:uncharacterized protein (TIGR03083 family)